MKRMVPPSPRTRLQIELLESRLAPATDVLTFHNDNFLSGANLAETTLTPANVNSSQFGQLFSYPVDGYVYAQPLYKSNLAIPGKGTHNVVFVATEHNSVYGFDADNPCAAGGLYWQQNLGPSVPQPDVISDDIVPEVGITGTPVIDPSTNTLFVVAKTRELVGGVAHYFQRLHALDLATGNERPGAPVTIGDTSNGNDNVTSVSVPGTGAGSVNGQVAFNALRENQRPALTLVNSVVTIAWASHGDNGPYHGWVVGYDAHTLALVRVFNTSPNDSEAGIWQSGSGLAADAQGNLYLATGNGVFDGVLGGPQALGQTGGGLGYTGITNSVAVKFDAYKPAGNHSSTGIYVNGHPPNNYPDTQQGDFWVDLAGTLIDFNAGAQASPPHTFQVILSYDGARLSETITDQTTSRSFSPAPYTVNIPAQVGGSTAYVGFTGADGGLNSTQDLQTWMFGSIINHASGFASHGDLTANGSAAFVGSAARLVSSRNYQTGTIFSNSRVNVANFTTTFTFQMRAGTNPVADGLTFTIQNYQSGAEFGDSVLKLSPSGGLSVADAFTPWDQDTLNRNDADLGSGGTMLLPDAVGSTAHPHLMIETGKEGKIYLLDRDNLGRYLRCGANCDDIVQTLQLGPAGVWGNPSFFQTGPNSGLIYYQGSGDVMKAFTISNGVLAGPTTTSATAFAFPGSQPVVSANGTANGIAWALQVDAFGQGGPAVLHAYNATNLRQELYNSSQAGLRDRLGGAVKFTAPVVTAGKVFVGTQNSLAVFGLFPSASQPPAAPSNLAAAGLSATQVQLTWTNHATNAAAVKVERSADGTNFTEVAQVSAYATSYTDGNLASSTTYFYRIRASNRIGDSAYSNTASAATHMAAAVLTVANVSSSQVDLSWTAVATDHYDVERSDDGGATFNVLATVPASVTGYSDAGLGQQVYIYRVHAYDSNDDSISIPLPVTVGLYVIDHSTGFTSTADLTANGSAQFAETAARLNFNYNQAGSVFANTRVDIRNFTTTFEIRLHEGTQPNPADGLTFTIQQDDRGPNALGSNGGGLGFGPPQPGATSPTVIRNSVAVKFDVYDNEGETSNATGIYFNGDYPGLAHAPGEVNVPLDPNVVNLRDQHTKQITLDYDGAHLVVTITDVSTGRALSQTYTVDIPGKVGSDTAYVGFTGGTGGLFSLQDVLNWSFAPRDSLPGGPSDLRLTYLAGNEVDLAWKANSYNEAGFSIERSTDGVNFTPIATVGPNVSSFVDPGRPNGTSFYRVRAFNTAGNSLASNVVLVNPVGMFPFHTDVGAIGIIGNTTLAGQVYTVRASGADVWDTADAFQFAAEPLVGNGQIVARVTSVQNTDFWAKAGVMIRASLAPGATNAFLALTPTTNGAAQFQWRTAIEGITTAQQTAAGSSHWVRLVRAGNTIRGYLSADGVNWTLVGSATLALPATVYVGLAVTAHNNDVLNTSTFDNVQITQAVQPLNRLSVSAAPSTTAGTVFTLMVAARDASNNRAPGYTGTIGFYSSDPGAALPDNYTFASTDAGYQTFAVSLVTAGVQTVAAVDLATGTIVGMAVITVNPGPATSFWVGGFPSPVTSGTPGVVTVAAIDDYGNVVPSYTGTVHLTSTDPQAYLDPDYTLTAADGGVAYFNTVLYTVGFQSIIATDVNTGITGEQDGIEVDPGGDVPPSTGYPGQHDRSMREPGVAGTGLLATHLSTVPSSAMAPRTRGTDPDAAAAQQAALASFDESPEHRREPSAGRGVKTPHRAGLVGALFAVFDGPWFFGLRPENWDRAPDR